MLVLTKENYHSKEANAVYMSNSQYKDFITCEAMAMAKISGEFISPPNDACSIGSYVHAAVEGELDTFRADHPELFTQKGTLYAKYEIADRMVETLRSDPLIQFVLQGQKEVIMTAELFGVPWKVRFDVYEPGKKIVDLKTVKNIRDRYWHASHGYTSFVDAFEYPRQLAIYLEIESRNTGRKGWLEPIIVAVSKEDVPDKEIITIDDDRLRFELEEVAKNMPRIYAVKRGIEPATRCEKCKHCRQTKKLTGIIHYTELMV